MTPLLPLCKMLTFTWDENNYMHFLQRHSIPFVDESRLCSPKMAFTPMWVDLLPQSCIIQGFATSDANQTKKWTIATNTPLINSSLLAIEVFGCLHKHVDVFLHNYVNAIWSLKRLEGLHLSTLVTFFRQKVLITLQRMQMPSIVSRAIVVGLTISQLPPLQDTPPITTTDLLQAIGVWHQNMANLPQEIGSRNGEILTSILSQLDVL